MNVELSAKKYADKLWERCNVLFKSEWVRSVQNGSVFTQIDQNDGKPIALAEPLEIVWINPLYPSMAFDHLRLSIETPTMKINVPSVGYLIIRGGNIIGNNCKDKDDPIYEEA
uniref:tRNA-specific 2-thiouridylase mnmA 2 n=1 Tax=Lygus hesperus TaxID=30085 RepID=A0A0A9ZAH3_LYGHE